MASSQHKAETNTDQNSYVNLGSQSEMILHNIPCLATMWYRNGYDNYSADILSAHGAQYIYFHNLFTIVYIELWPVKILVKWMIRSIVTFSKGYIGTGKGCSFPWDTYTLSFDYYHTKQLHTYEWQSWHMPCQWYLKANN